jgi:hypothetical protein
MPRMESTSARQVQHATAPVSGTIDQIEKKIALMGPARLLVRKASEGEGVGFKDAGHSASKSQTTEYPTGNKECPMTK